MARPPKYTSEILKKQLQDKARELGRPPTAEEVNTDPNMASISTHLSYNHTHSWGVVLQNAGIIPQKPPKKHYTDEELIAQLRAKYNELGRSPSRPEVGNDPTMANPNTYIFRFGTTGWNKMLQKVGLPPVNKKDAEKQHLVHSKEDLIACLKLMHASLGRLPTRGEVDHDPTTPNPLTYAARFGQRKWIDILAAAGLFNPETDLLEMKTQLLFKAMTIGGLPSYLEVLDDPEMEHPEIYIAAFGMNWEDLMETLH